MVSRRLSAVAAPLLIVVYATLWAATARHWRWLQGADDAVLREFVAFGAVRPEWVALWQAISTVLSPNGMRTIAAVLVAVALVRRRWHIAAFVAVTVGLMGPVTAVAKGIADRPRPAGALVDASSSSFPSGHALGVMAAVLAFLTVLWPMIAARWHAAAATAAAVVIVLAGVSRVVLTVHHVSDVVAGWALGYLWFLFCVSLVPPYRSGGRAGTAPRRHQRRPWG